MDYKKTREIIASIEDKELRAMKAHDTLLILRGEGAEIEGERKELINECFGAILEYVTLDMYNVFMKDVEELDLGVGAAAEDLSIGIYFSIGGDGPQVSVELPTFMKSASSLFIHKILDNMLGSALKRKKI